jgi:hypothetical protein
VQTWVNNPNDYTLPKAVYARERWGTTIFYVDSVLEWFGCWWYDTILKKYPDVLLLPEWSRTRGFAGAAPFSYTKFTGWTHGVPAAVKACWPNAFICMSNVDYSTPAGREGALHAVQQGNVLMFNCWYANEEARYIKQIYALAGARHTPVAADQQVDCTADTEQKIVLRAIDEDKEALRYTVLEPPKHGTIARLDAATGLLFYKPHEGFTGDDFFSFKATDPSGLDSNRASIQVFVEAE